MNKSVEPIINRLKAQVNSPQMRMFLGLIIAVFLLFTFLIPGFNYIKIQNLNNILTDSVIPAIFAFGMGIIIAGSGFDLSLGLCWLLGSSVRFYGVFGRISNQGIVLFLLSWAWFIFRICNEIFGKSFLRKHTDHKQKNTSRSLISIIDQYFSPLFV